MHAGHRVVALLAAALAAVALAQDARAQAPSDLTGTWQGNLSCTFTFADDGTKAKDAEKGLLLLVKKLADGPNGAEYAANFAGTQNFSGRTIDVGGLGSGKGVLALADCGDDDDPWTGQTEVTRLKFAVNADKGTGKLSGEAVFSESNGEPQGGGSGTCKLAFKRIDAVDPNDVNGCE